MKEWLLFSALSFGAVFGGYFFGAWVRYPESTPSYATILTEVAGLLTAIGYSVAKIDVRLFPTRCATVCGWSLLYAAAMAVTDPFAHFAKLGMPPIVVISVAMLPIPLVFAIASQLRYREWFSVVGITIFVFACYALLAANLKYHYGGAGFFASWHVYY